jgi:response regulator NasT
MKQSLRIAVADDEPDMRDFYRRMLPRLGHAIVAEAQSGRELVDRCRAAAPDLVITDIRMPELDGIEAAALVYRDRPVPIILVSAYHDAELIERAEAEHVLGYLVKPIKLADLEPAIVVAIRRFQQVQELKEALARVKQLQGLLPMCGYCKKIRDDKNYWQEVESYISGHSEARFSHSICPACYEQFVRPQLEISVPADEHH